MIGTMQSSPQDAPESARADAAQPAPDDEDKRQAFDDELELWILASST
jgi:hypothetical protein